MAGRIPVGRTIARAYGFAFGNIVNNLGAIWISMALFYALFFFFQREYMAALMNMTGGDPSSVMAAMPFLGCAAIVVFMILAQQIAAVTKEALGLRTGSAFAQFPFDAAAWRLMASYLLFYVALCVIYVILLVGTFVLSLIAAAIAAQMSPAAFGLIGLALALFVLCAVVYISVRLSFLLPPVVVAEKRISLIRAWELTGGNFWRIVAVLLAVWVPLIVVDGIYLHQIYGGHFLPPLHGTPDQLRDFLQQRGEISRHMMEWSQRHWFVVYPIGVAVSLIVLGLFAGATAFSYQALTGSDETAD